MRRIVFGAAVFTAMVAQAFGQPQPSPLAGKFRVEGLQVGVSAERTEAVEGHLVFEVTDGKLKVSRTGRYLRPRFGLATTAFSWVGEGKVEGRTAQVTFKVPLNPNATGIVDALDGNGNGNNAPTEHNVFTAVYQLSEDDRMLTEVITNTTRKKPENWWTRIEAKGLRTDSLTRVKLGGSVEVKRPMVDVFVPTDGTLTLKTSKGLIKALVGPDGSVSPVGSAQHVLDVKKEGPLGAYAIQLEDAEGATLSASFVQKGKIDPRIRPWSSHTYYPLNEDNANALHVKGGPLEKFDKALNLTGRDAALFWEKGTDYRTTIGLERGHYTKVQTPTEKNAELDWFADLNGDGTIGGSPVDAFTAIDKDQDGKATRAEALPYFRDRAIEGIFRDYDTNGDGRIGKGEVNDRFLEAYGTAMIVTKDQWRAALLKDFGQVVDNQANAAINAFFEKAKEDAAYVTKAESQNMFAADFMDSSDVDEDFNTFFDRDNVRVVAAVDSKSYFGNKVVEQGGKVQLYKGYNKDQLVIELPKSEVKRIDRGIGDGDLDDSYSIGWWGHCNAWAMAAIIFRKPAGEFSANGVTLTVRDQKGILVELAMGDTEDSSFTWDQWGNRGQDVPAKKYAAGFHRQLKKWLREEQKGMMADMDLKDPIRRKSFAVWNYPLLGYEAVMSEPEGDDPFVLSCRVAVEKGSYSDEDASSTASLTYDLHFQGGEIREDDGSRTDWTTKEYIDGEQRRAYIRYLIHPFRLIGRGSSGNPNLTLERVQQLFGERLQYNTLDGN